MCSVTRISFLVMAAAAVGGLLLTSCTVNQTLDIAADGSGVLTTHAEVAPLLHDYLAGLAQAAGGGLTDGQVFEPDAVRKSFQSRPGIVVRKAAAPTPSSLDLEDKGPVHGVIGIVRACAGSALHRML